MEFVAATADPREVDIQEVNQAFRLLDQDNKGFINNADLARVLGTATADDREIEHVQQEEMKLAKQNSITGGMGILPSLSNYKSSSFNSIGKLGSRNNSNSSINHLKDAEQTQSMAKQAQRRKKMNEKIRLIIQQADVNNDGVISYT